MTEAGGITRRAAVFLDRDGTIIREKHYLSDPDEVELVPGTLDALRALRDVGLPYVIVTNQSGIARGLYTEEDYHRVAARLQGILEDGGVAPAATRYCPHHPDVTGPCECRKPATGMYRDAAAVLDLDLAASWYVGDKATDVLPARSLGGKGILVRTGHWDEELGSAPEGVTVVKDLAAAVGWILSNQENGPRTDVDPSGGLG